jgi:hypothetical protein
MYAPNIFILRIYGVTQVFSIECIECGIHFVEFFHEFHPYFLEKKGLTLLRCVLCRIFPLLQFYHNHLKTGFNILIVSIMS